MFITPKDYDYKAWDLGESIDVFDVNKVTTTTVEPMGLARAACADGGRGLISLMEEYAHRCVRPVPLIQYRKSYKFLADSC